VLFMRLASAPAPASQILDSSSDSVDVYFQTFCVFAGGQEHTLRLAAAEASRSAFENLVREIDTGGATRKVTS